MFNTKDRVLKLGIYLWNSHCDHWNFDIGNQAMLPEVIFAAICDAEVAFTTDALFVLQNVEDPGWVDDAVLLYFTVV